MYERKGISNLSPYRRSPLNADNHVFFPLDQTHRNSLRVLFLVRDCDFSQKLSAHTNCQHLLVVSKFLIASSPTEHTIARKSFSFFPQLKTFFHMYLVVYRFYFQERQSQTISRTSGGFNQNLLQTPNTQRLPIPMFYQKSCPQRKTFLTLHPYHGLNLKR